MTATEQERAEDVDYHVFDAGGLHDTSLQTEESSCAVGNNQVVEKPNRGLQDVVEKLQSLWMTRHEIDTASTGSPVDQEPQALLCWRNDQYCSTDRSAELETQELHAEEVKMPSAKLRFSTTQREAMIVSSAAKLAEAMAASRVLENELHTERRLTQAREKEILNLKTRVEALAASNHMLQSMMSLKKASMKSMMNLKKTDSSSMMNLSRMDPEKTDSSSMMGPEKTDSSSVMNLSMMDVERKSAMESIEGELVHLGAIARTQNACVVRLALQNEFLHSKVLEGDADLAAAVCALEQLKRRMLEWAADYDNLRAYALGLEGELREFRFVFHELEEVRRERDELVSDVGKRESDLRECEEEVESVGREALRVSLEVELLRRKVRQLEEDVMVKDGQISILRGRRVPEFMEAGTSAY